jgi:acetyl-CoA acetyltransferase
MTLDLTDQAVVCGVGESDYGRRLGRSSIDLGADAIRAAVTDAGLTKNDVDGMVVTFGSPLGADADTLAFSLGLELRAYNQTWAHGRFTGSALQWAAITVAAGLADVVACLAAVSFSGVRRLRVGGGGDREGAREGGGAHGEDPVYGMTSPGAGAALMAQKYFARYGATSEDLASVPRAFRRHATLNPLAMYQEPLTVDAYLAARYVAEPLRIFDYCQVGCRAFQPAVTSSCGPIRGSARPNRTSSTGTPATRPCTPWLAPPRPTSTPFLPTMPSRPLSGWPSNDGGSAVWERPRTSPRTVASSWGASFLRTPTAACCPKLMSWGGIIRSRSCANYEAIADPAKSRELK